MRNESRLPPVTSRTKKFASLAPMSQVCAVKPPLLFCSKRMAGVSLVLMWRSRTGLELRKPTLPLLATKSDAVGAPAVTLNGCLEPVMSSNARKLAPPLAESFAVICQSLVGNAPTLVSSNLMRRLFSFRRMVSNPKLSLLTQSKPTQRLPWTMRSSGNDLVGLRRAGRRRCENAGQSGRLECWKILHPCLPYLPRRGSVSVVVAMTPPLTVNEPPLETDLRMNSDEFLADRPLSRRAATMVWPVVPTRW